MSTCHDAEIQGMRDAERRHGGPMYPAQIEQQYREIQARVPSPVVYRDEPERDTGELTPAQKRQLKMFSILAPVSCFSVGIGYVVMTGALNYVIGLCIGGGVAMSLISSMFSGSNGDMPKTGSRQSGGSSGGDGDHYEWHFYNRSNNQNERK